MHDNVRPLKRANGKNFVCEICAKTFSYAGNLEQHKWTHMTEDKTRMQCDICGKFTVFVLLIYQ